MIKHKIKLILILFPLIINSQVFLDLSEMTSDITLGNECGLGDYLEYETYGDAHLNGFNITIKNCSFIINGQLHSGGGLVIIPSGCPSIFKYSSVSSEEYTLDQLEFIDDRDKKFKYSDGILTVKGAKEIGLANMVGQVILKEKGNSLNIENVNKGVYVLFAHKDNTTITCKIII